MGIGDRIRAAREAKGWGANELDRQARYATGTTSRLERGERGTRRGMGSETLVRFADALGVRPAWLLTGEGPMTDAEPVTEGDELALAVDICRKGGRPERAIEYVLAMPRPENWRKLPALYWIEKMRVITEFLAGGIELPPNPAVGARSKKRHR